MFAGRGGWRAVALVLALLTVVAGCQGQFPGLNLVIATGSSDGVYYQLGSKLADSWAQQLNISRPKVLETAGSPDNIRRLQDGTADVAFGTADTVNQPDQGPRKLRALARIYDDYIQVVVRGDAPIHQLSDLAGRRVSVGSVNSQTLLVANRILQAAGVHNVIPVEESLNDTIAAMDNGTIDAFIWSGGMPTPSIVNLDKSVTVRLLDLGNDPSGVLTKMTTTYPVYGTAVVPAGTYQAGSDPVTTLTVPNFLLVTDRMPNDVAEALVNGLFNAADQLARVNRAALAIDVHTAIYTDPVLLHPGAENYYRSAKV
jgi:TRAP transporter TAXI family solute receptor